MSDQIGRATVTHLYRLYDSAGALLYAGISTNVDRRLSEHRMSKRWYRSVARVETDEYQSRWRAALAELSAGRGRHGIIPGGIGKGLVANMTDEELSEAAAHPAYARRSDGTLARQWGLPVRQIRELRTRAIAPASVTSTSASTA
jgi:hypothetical protein